MKTSGDASGVTVMAPTEDTGTQTVDLLSGATDQDGDTLSISNLVKTSGDASGVTVDGTDLKVDTTAYHRVSG